MTDPKLQAIAQAAAALEIALNEYRRPVNVEIDVTHWQHIESEEQNSSYRVRVTRVTTERIHP